MIIGFAFSVGLMLLRLAYPTIVVTEENPPYGQIRKHRTKPVTSKLLLTIKGDLQFLSAPYIEDEILRLVSRHPHIKQVSISGASASHVDLTAHHVLTSLSRRLGEKGIRLCQEG